MREVWTNYYKVLLYVTTYQNWGEGKVNTRKDDGADRQKKPLGTTGRTLGIESIHPIGLGFSRIIIQSEF